MCGIVGMIANRDVVPTLLSALQRLEYRGYDSAGIATINEQKTLKCTRVTGKVAQLCEQLQDEALDGTVGIAHTRWATHGKACTKNAHPHLSNDKIAVVHNGIIENYRELRENLEKTGYTFHSETDTEVIPHLIHQALEQEKDLLAAIQATLPQLKGAFSIAVIDADSPDQLIACRQASPLVIGIGKNENFLASDQLALLAETQDFIYLDEGDVAVITTEQIKIYDAQGQTVEREVQHSTEKDEAAELGDYNHFMEKEIFQQPDAIANTLEVYLTKDHLLMERFGEASLTLFPKIQHIQIIACGTSYHAAMVARYWIERYANLPCAVEVASEFRYRKHVVQANTLFITISQSGETADTIAALKQAKAKNYLASLTICNVPQSSLVRESDIALMTRAGTEIGVASTKAFTTQLTALLLLTAALAKTHAEFDEAQFAKDIHSLPKLVEATLALDKDIAKLAEQFANKHNALFLGRGIQYPIAMEGALKLKEISYIHAEAYPAGELKHGPLALIDEEIPVIAVAPNDHLIEKLRANIQEVRARGGKLYVFAEENLKISEQENLTVIKLPTAPEILEPIIYTIPLQLLSYHVALERGTNIDKPRNLAKSVTVE